MEGLSKPPALDLGVVAAAQHLGHAEATEVGWAREVRFLEKS
jgi:hypothetical protein